MLTSAIADDEGKADIGWNFAKFLVDGSGSVVARFSPKVTPEEIAGKLGDYA
jgi:glutathione peroxidase-family protein